MYVRTREREGGGDDEKQPVDVNVSMVNSAFDGLRGMTKSSQVTTCALYKFCVHVAFSYFLEVQL